MLSITQNRTIGLLIAPALLLLVPLLAMPFIDGMDRDLFDFLVMGVMMYVAVFAYLLLTRVTKTRKQRIVVGLGILAAFLWLWAELAVGIFTNWES